MVQFGRKFVAYEEREAEVAAAFEDQSTAAGAVLIGVEGAGSRVRAQLLVAADDSTAVWLLPDTPKRVILFWIIRVGEDRNVQAV